MNMKKNEKKMDNDGIKIGLHSSWAQHVLVILTIFYIEYIVRILVVLHSE